MMEWIPVTERLPEDGSKVLVHGYEWNDKENPSFQMVCLYKNGFHSWIDDQATKDGGYWSESDNVYAFHWQPLPPPPQ